MADYILNMGGFDNSEYRTTVDVFNVTKNKIEMVTGHDLALRIGRDEVAAAACGNYVLAMGGGVGWAGGYTSAVDIFKATDNGIEQITDHGLSLSQARCTAAAAAGNYVLAMGGYTGLVWLDTVDVFKVTENGVEAVTEHGLSLSTERYQLAAASAGNYILALGGGVGWTETSNVVDVFHVTDNGVEKVTDHGLSLSVARRQLAAAACGEYILAVGGYDGTGALNTIDVFKVTENGVEQITDHGLTLSVPRYDLAAVAIKDYIFVMGGLGSSLSDAVDVFKVTANGIEHILNHGLTLSVARRQLAAAAAGDFVLALGGRGTGYLNTIDVFQIIK